MGQRNDPPTKELIRGSTVQTNNEEIVSDKIGSINGFLEVCRKNGTLYVLYKINNLELIMKEIGILRTFFSLRF